MKLAPVGIFDSGLGGLSVAREIRALLPGEPLLYLADSAHCPYGGRPASEIQELSVAAVGELVSRGVKAVVVACNTASGVAIETLRATYSLPIVALEPAVKPAVAASRNRLVGVMATAATLRTERFARLVTSFANDARVIPQPCPGIVELVESGVMDSERARPVLEPLIAPLREAGVDTVVLGCTHYPLLRPVIAELFGPGVRLVDSGNAVARRLERVLWDARALAGVGAPGGLHLLTTGDPEEVAEVAERLWGAPLGAEHVDLDYEPDQSRSNGGAPGASSR
jgi:glutamate racemase